MVKKNFDMSSLLATKGEGSPASDSPMRPITKEINEEIANRRNKEQTVSSEYVNLGFKVPKEFRHRLRKIAAHNDVSLVEVLRVAIDLYEQKYINHE